MFIVGSTTENKQKGGAPKHTHTHTHTPENPRKSILNKHSCAETNWGPFSDKFKFLKADREIASQNFFGSSLLILLEGCWVLDY